jgi:hypothetical protein
MHQHPADIEDDVTNRAVRHGAAWHVADRVVREPACQVIRG